MKVVSFEKNTVASAKLIVELSATELAPAQNEAGTSTISKAAQDLVDPVLNKALKDNDLKPVGVPEYYLRDLEAEERVELTVSVEIFPEPDITGYDSIEISVPLADISPEQIADIISDMIVAQASETGESEAEVTLNDQLAEQLVPGVGGVAGLQEHVRTLEAKRFGSERMEDVRAGIFSWLLERNPFPVPRQMIDDEIRNILVAEEVVPSELAQSAGSIEVTPDHRRRCQEMARDRVRLAIILDRISEVEDIQASEEDIEQAIHDLAREHNSTYAETREYLMENGFIMEVILGVIQDSVLRFLLDRTSIIEQPLQ